jgi:hypothetical protein
VEELRKAMRAAEQNRQAAMHALAEERQRSLELQVKISRQVCMETQNSCRDGDCLDATIQQNMCNTLFDDMYLFCPINVFW